MIQVTATDFKSNLGKYLSLVAREEIHITKNGADVAVLVRPERQADWVDNMSGVIQMPEIDIKDAKLERLVKKYESLD